MMIIENRYILENSTVRSHHLLIENERKKIFSFLQNDSIIIRKK